MGYKKELKVVSDMNKTTATEVPKKARLKQCASCELNFLHNWCPYGQPN